MRIQGFSRILKFCGNSNFQKTLKNKFLRNLHEFSEYYRKLKFYEIPVNWIYFARPSLVAVYFVEIICDLNSRDVLASW